MQPASVFKGCWVPSPALSGSHKGLSSVGWEGMTLEDFGREGLCVYYLCMHHVCPAMCVCVYVRGWCVWDVLVCMSVFAYDPMCSLAQMCMHAHVVLTRGLCPLKGVPASQLRVTMIWSRTVTNMSEKTNEGEKAEKWHRRAERLALNPVVQILQTLYWSHKSACFFSDLGNIHYPYERDHFFNYETHWVMILKQFRIEMFYFIIL